MVYLYLPWYKIDNFYSPCNWIKRPTPYKGWNKVDFLENEQKKFQAVDNFHSPWNWIKRPTPYTGWNKGDFLENEQKKLQAVFRLYIWLVDSS